MSAKQNREGSKGSSSPTTGRPLDIRRQRRDSVGGDQQKMATLRKKHIKLGDEFKKIKLGKSFLEAVIGGDLVKVRSAVAKSKEPAAVVVSCRDDKTKDTALHLAAEFGHAEIVNFLIQNGADVNARNIDGETPLIIACSENSVKCAMVLLQAKADVAARDNAGKSSLAYSIQRQDLAAVQVLLDQGVPIDGEISSAGNSPLHEACAVGSTKITSLLLKRGANVNIAHPFTGNTPLHFAALNGFTGCVSALLGYRADTTACNGNGNTAQAMAIHAGNSDLGAVIQKMASQQRKDAPIDATILVQSLAAQLEALDRQRANIQALLRDLSKKTQSNTGDEQLLAQRAAEREDLERQQLQLEEQRSILEARKAEAEEIRSQQRGTLNNGQGGDRHTGGASVQDAPSHLATLLPSTEDLPPPTTDDSPLSAIVDTNNQLPPPPPPVESDDESSFSMPVVPVLGNMPPPPVDQAALPLPNISDGPIELPLPPAPILPLPNISDGPIELPLPPAPAPAQMTNTTVETIDSLPPPPGQHGQNLPQNVLPLPPPPGQMLPSPPGQMLASSGMLPPPPSGATPLDGNNAPVGIVRQPPPIILLQEQTPVSTTVPSDAFALPPPPLPAQTSDESLPPLPSGWVAKEDDLGRVYFIDTINRITAWDDPRTGKKHPKTMEYVESQRKT